MFESLSEPLIRLETLGKHPTSELFELCQKKGMAVSFQTAAWRETNAVEVLVDGKFTGRGTYGHKKEVAQNRAAKAALDHLKMMFANADGGSPANRQSHPEEAHDHMIGREEIMIDMSNHTSSGESDDDGKTTPTLLNPAEELHGHMLGREEMNNISDHTPSDDGKTDVLSNTEELHDHPLGREEIMSHMSVHTSSGESDDGGKTSFLLSNTEELHDHMLGHAEIMNNMSDHTSIEKSDDDRKIVVLISNTEELHDHMLGSKEIMNNMPDHTSSGESDDDGRKTIIQNHAACCAGKAIVNNLSFMV